MFDQGFVQVRVGVDNIINALENEDISNKWITADLKIIGKDSLFRRIVNKYLFRGDHYGHIRATRVATNLTRWIDSGNSSVENCRKAITILTHLKNKTQKYDSELQGSIDHFQNLIDGQQEPNLQEEEIDELPEEEIDELRGQLRQKEEEHERNEAQLRQQLAAEYDRRIEGLRQQLDQEKAVHKRDNEAHRQTEQDLERQLDEHQQTTNRLGSELNKHEEVEQELARKLEQERETHKGDNTAHGQAVSALRSRLAEKEKVVGGLRTELENLQKAEHALREQLKKEQEVLQQKEAEHAKNMQQLRKQLVDKETDIEELNLQLHRENREHQKEVSDLTTQLEEQRKTVSDVQGQLEGHKRIRDTLRSELNKHEEVEQELARKLEQEREAHKGDNTEHGQAVSALESRLHEQQQTVEALKTNLARHEQAEKTLNGKLAKQERVERELSAELDQKNRQLQDKDQELIALREQRDDLRDKLQAACPAAIRFYGQEIDALLGDVESPWASKEKKAAQLHAVWPNFANLKRAADHSKHPEDYNDYINETHGRIVETAKKQDLYYPELDLDKIQQLAKRVKEELVRISVDHKNIREEDREGRKELNARCERQIENAEIVLYNLSKQKKMIALGKEEQQEKKELKKTQGEMKAAISVLKSILGEKRIPALNKAQLRVIEILKKDSQLRDGGHMVEVYDLTSKMKHKEHQQIVDEIIMQEFESPIEPRFKAVMAVGGMFQAGVKTQYPEFMEGAILGDLGPKADDLYKNSPIKLKQMAEATRRGFQTAVDNLASMHQHTQEALGIEFAGRERLDAAVKEYQDKIEQAANLVEKLDLVKGFKTEVQAIHNAFTDAVEQRITEVLPGLRHAGQALAAAKNEQEKAQADFDELVARKANDKECKEAAEGLAEKQAEVESAQEEVKRASLDAKPQKDEWRERIQAKLPQYKHSMYNNEENKHGLDRIIAHLKSPAAMDTLGDLLKDVIKAEHKLQQLA
ncbi:MAG: hypothetical protein WB791_00085 [Waddliaceae bacterium]